MRKQMAIVLIIVFGLFLFSCGESTGQESQIANSSNAVDTAGTANSSSSAAALSVVSTSQSSESPSESLKVEVDERENVYKTRAFGAGNSPDGLEYSFFLLLPEGWETPDKENVRPSFHYESIELNVYSCTDLDTDTDLREKYIGLVEGRARLAREQVILAMEDYVHSNGNIGFFISYTMDYAETDFVYYYEYHFWIEEGMCLNIECFSQNSLEPYRTMIDDIVGSIESVAD